MRAIVSAALLALALSADGHAEPAPAALRRSDPFVVSGDACGASRYAHLLGREFVTLHQASLPAQTRIVNAHMVSTLEYRPERLNLILGGEGRVIVIGCF
ncbi:MAG: I78 family peptidase inhibitor [Hyphomonadaceae bacterium]